MQAIAKLVRRHRGTALLIDCTHSLVPEIQLPAQDCLALLMQLLEEQGLLLSSEFSAMAIEVPECLCTQTPFGQRSCELSLLQSNAAQPTP